MFAFAVRRLALGLRPALAAALLLAAVALLLAVFALPGAANVLPESALLIHVRPVTGTCVTSITNCDQIEDLAPTLGTWEFLMFFMPIHWQLAHEPVELRGLDCDLVWPDTWELTGGEFCSGWGGQLDLNGPPYHFQAGWDCADLPIGNHEVFLIARFEFTVNGPGRFDFADPRWGSTVTLGCPSAFLTYPKGCGAEVAPACAFTHIPCGYGPTCAIDFSPAQLELLAAPGDSAVGEVELQTDLCTLRSLEPMADWLSVSATNVGFRHYKLAVTADASNLAVGTYESWIRAEAETIGRCLPVTFVVGETTPMPGMTWGAIKALYR
jgi:hypothetical protein